MHSKSNLSGQGIFKNTLLPPELIPVHRRQISLLNFSYSLSRTIPRELFANLNIGVYLL